MSSPLANNYLSLKPDSDMRTNMIHIQNRTVRPEFTRLFEVLDRFFKIYYASGTAPCIWCAGGAFRNVLNGHKINDLDLYSPDPMKALARIKELIKTENGARCIKEYPSSFTFALPQAETAGDDTYSNLEFQLINATYGDDPIKTLRTFDFVCCMAAYDGARFYHATYFVDDNDRKMLHYIPVGNPLRSLWRAFKFSKEYSFHMPFRTFQSLLSHMQEQSHTVKWRAILTAGHEQDLLDYGLWELKPQVYEDLDIPF